MTILRASTAFSRARLSRTLSIVPSSHSRLAVNVVILLAPTCSISFSQDRSVKIVIPNRNTASRISRLPTALKAWVKLLPMAWPRIPPAPWGRLEPPESFIAASAVPAIMTSTSPSARMPKVIQSKPLCWWRSSRMMIAR